VIEPIKGSWEHSDTALVFGVAPLFLIAGAGWASVRLSLAYVLIPLRFSLAVIMLVALWGAHLYGCEDYGGAPGCEIPDQSSFGTFRVVSVLSIAVPMVSAVALFVFLLPSLRPSVVSPFPRRSGGGRRRA
jgi:hypothetical protein